MKEQIQELVCQAEGVVTNKMMTGRKQYTFLEEDLEKFVELIVRECAGIYSKIDNGNSHMGTDDYLEALHKTFFGVEE